MVKLTVNKKALIRTPRFPFNSQLADRWAELKILIRDSSPAFYDIIKDMSYEELSRAEAKVRISVQKYFNRACYRSTPYGAFAAVGITRLSTVPDSELLVPAQLDLHSFTDWNTPTDELVENVREGRLLFFANSSYYRLQDEIRFIQRQEGNYIMSAVDYDPAIQLILESCSTPVSYDTLLDKMAATLQDAELCDYLSDLINLQLILTNRNRNIIGEDYFLRTQSECTGPSQYVIAERKTKGTTDQKLFRYLPELAHLLQKLASTEESAELRQFKERFIRKFEQQEVPLMLALDPEAGVGYGDMAQHEASGNLEPFIGYGVAAPLNAPEHPLKNALLRHLLNENEDKIPLRLETTLLPERSVTKQLPNSLTAGCTVVDDLLFLDFMGGASANTIYGRFAHAIPVIQTYCREIADQEQAANPHVLFFDVGYTKELKVDNINRRPTLYGLQLNILNYDTSEKPLAINDIYLGLQGNEIILRSRSLNRRLLPRMATAYNYQRSDLPLFRLLMDIQAQSLTASLGLKSSNLLPDLSYYPRIQYKNIVVASASWQLSKNIVSGEKSETAKMAMLKNHLQANEVTQYVKAGIADQTLLLDTNAQADLLLLLSLVEKARDGKLIIEEAALPKHASVKDEYGGPYLPQIILTLQHDEPIAQPLTKAQREFPATATKQWIPPGEDWLYFEIYCSPYRADELLSVKIEGFLEQYRHKIVKWFFIRYNETGDHIRLRLQLKDVSAGYTLIRDISAVLRPELESGLVSDIKICTYKKEVHRYDPAHMDAVETHFYRDSEYVLSTIREMLPDNAKYRLCTAMFTTVAESGIIAPANLTHFLGKISDAYNQEHGIKQAQFKEINSRYKVFSKENLPSLGLRAEALYERLKVSFIEVIASYPELIRPKVLGDLLHMHINRLFIHQQRLHEMVFYNFLSLHQKMQRHIKATTQQMN